MGGKGFGKDGGKKGAKKGGGKKGDGKGEYLVNKSYFDVVTRSLLCVASFVTYSSDLTSACDHMHIHIPINRITAIN